MKRKTNEDIYHGEKLQEVWISYFILPDFDKLFFDMQKYVSWQPVWSKKKLRKKEGLKKKFLVIKCEIKKAGHYNCNQTYSVYGLYYSTK